MDAPFDDITNAMPSSDVHFLYTRSFLGWGFESKITSRGKRFARHTCEGDGKCADVFSFFDCF
jgi:hypothetical protein